MRRIICAALLLLPAPALGQESGDADAAAGRPPAFVRVGDVEGEAARLLRSGANAERAWGAYLAGLHGLKGQTPALVRALEDPTLGDSWEHTLVRQSALDALIRLEAKVPAEVLRTLTQGSFSDEAVILMAAAPAENQSVLLETFTAQDGDGSTGTHWLALGNLLAETEAPGFAAQLLKGLKVKADITVMDREEGRGGNGGGGCGCGCGRSFYKPPEGFPPATFYHLTTNSERGAVVVAPGRHPVYYIGSGTPGGSGCGCDGARDRDIVRVEYLASLLGTYEEELDLDPRPSEVVVCKDQRQCRRELARVRNEIERAYAAVVNRLVESELLGGAGDAPAAPDITFTLTDERQHKTYPLPAALRGVTILIEDVPDDEAAGEAEP